ncbi:MAG: hypothetical protein ACTSUE_03800 [Promethearchaeota archaeon]
MKINQDRITKKKIVLATFILFLALSAFNAPFPREVQDHPAKPGGTGVFTRGGGDLELKRSALAPFSPNFSRAGYGSNLHVVDTFNGTIRNYTKEFLAGNNRTVPLIAPANTSEIIPVPAANISRVRLTVEPGDDPVVEIPWNESVSLENVSMDGSIVAQSFYLSTFTFLENVSIFGHGVDHTFGTWLYDVNVTIYNGLPEANNIAISKAWSGINAYSIVDASPDWHAFDMPGTVLLPGPYTLSVAMNKSIASVFGDFYFFKVNDTGVPAEASFSYNGTNWVNETGDFSIKLGIENSGNVLLDDAEFRARLGDGSWKNISIPSREIVFGPSDGGPWVPEVGTFDLIWPYFGVPLTIYSNESMSLNISIDIEYEVAGNLVNSSYSLGSGMPNVSWSFTYNATIASFNDLYINGTGVGYEYEMHVQPGSQSFSIDIPGRWEQVASVSPGNMTFGSTASITIDNSSSYNDSIWQFGAESPYVLFIQLLNGSEFFHGEYVNISGVMAENFTNTYSGDASIWSNETVAFWGTTDSFSGENFSFSTDFHPTNSTELPAGYYSSLVILGNGTDFGFHAEQFTLKYQSNAYLVENRSHHDIEGYAGDFITANVFLEINDSGAGLAGATVNTTWGAEGEGWTASEGSNAGEYTVVFNTNSTYCNPGDSRSVNVTFQRVDTGTTSLELYLHPWINTTLVHGSFNTTFHVNETSVLSLNYSDVIGNNLIAHGLDNLSVEYSLGSFTSQQLGFTIDEPSNWTFSIEVNTTKIPATTKSGNYALNASMQAKLINGTWYEPQELSLPLTVVPLELNLSVARFDTTYNASVDAFAVSEFESISEPSPVWLDIEKLLFNTSVESGWIEAGGLQVQASVNGTVVVFLPDGVIPGRYKANINLSLFTEPGVHNVPISITGNDVEPYNANFTVEIISRYKLQVTLDQDVNSLIEDTVISLSLVITYTDKDNASHVFSNENVTVVFKIYEGTLPVSWEEDMKTDGDGRIFISGIRVPKVKAGAYFSVHVVVEGNKTIDPNYKDVITIPLEQSFWGRNGLTVILIILAAALSVIFFIKNGIPTLKLKRERKKIALIRESGSSETPVTPRDVEMEIEVTDTNDMRASDNVSIIHMGPDELLDLDVSIDNASIPKKNSGKNSRGKSLTTWHMMRSRVLGPRKHAGTTATAPASTSRRASSSFTSQSSGDSSSTGVITSWDLYKQERDLAKARGEECEANNDLEGALEYYRRAKTFAEKLGDKKLLNELDEKISKLEIKLRW